MSTKELIYSEVEKMSVADLAQLYDHVRNLNASRGGTIPGEGALAKLSRIKIHGPADFARNVDLYLSGEKAFPSEADAD